jgi:hypothetical protein
MFILFCVMAIVRCTFRLNFVCSRSSWFVSLREEHRTILFDNKILWKAYGEKQNGIKRRMEEF